jgi:hypothetical protein
MICINSFPLLISRHLDIVGYFVFHLYTLKLQDEVLNKRGCM